MVIGQAARGRPADPRRQGARRPHRERRVRGRQERAGVRRGPDPDARGADQERHDHRREPLHRPRPDRLDRRRSRAATARRRSRSSARPRPSRAEGRISNESPVGRALLGKQEGREGRRPASRPATSPTRSSASASRRGVGAWTGPTSSRRRPSSRAAGRQRLEDAVGHRPRRQPARAGHPRRHHPRPARQRHRDDAPLRRRRPRPDGRPGAADARRDRALDGPPAGPRPGPGGRLPRRATPATSRASSSTRSPASASSPTATTG